MEESQHSTEESSQQNYQDEENTAKEFQDKENSPPKIKAEGNHQCELCGKVFAVESRLKRHVATHTGSDKVQCEICSKILGARDQYVVHMKRLHGVDVTRNTAAVNKKKCFSCEVCGKIFVNGYKLRRHMNVHTGEEKSQCLICFRWVASKQALAKHVERHDQRLTDNVTIECRQCNMTFPTIQHILEHMNIHTESEQFMCSMCVARDKEDNSKKKEVNFNNKTDFMLHIMTLHPFIHSLKGGKSKKIQECHICSKTFPGHSALLRHINYHTRVNQMQCKLCNKNVATKDHLPLHMDRYHPELYQKILQLYPKKPTGFTCEYCGEKFPGRYKLETHRRVHEMYQCPLCPTRLQTTDTLNKHMELHVENGYTGDVASIMPEKKTLIPKFEPENKEKISKGDLIASLMENDFKQLFLPSTDIRSNQGSAADQLLLNEETGETESVIKSAAAQFAAADAEASAADNADPAAQHLQVYLNKYRDQLGKRKADKKSKKSSYTCSECSKVCPTLSRLRRHMNSHTGQQRVKCRLCKKSISNKDHLDLHIKRKHPEVYSRINKFYSRKQAGFVCSGCNKKFPCRSKLERHVRVHIKAFQCPMCDVRSHSTVGLRSHLNLHLDDGGRQQTLEDIESILANSQVKMEDLDSSPTKSKGEWIMELMEKNFKDLPGSDDDSNPGEDFANMEIDDDREDDHDDTSEKETKHEIQDGDEDNEPDKDKMEHEEEHVEATDDVKLDLSGANTVKPEAFACNLCSREFVLHHELKQHVLNHITVKVFECELCHETFSTRKWIQIHGTQCSGQNRLRTSSELTICCSDCDIYFENTFDQTNHHKLFHEEDFDTIKEEEIEDETNEAAAAQNELTEAAGVDEDHKEEEDGEVTCKLEEANTLQGHNNHEVFGEEVKVQRSSRHLMEPI